MRPVALAPFVALLACTFDPSGLDTAGPPTPGSTGGSTSTSTTETPGSTSTTDAPDPTTGTTVDPSSTTDPVDPTTGGPRCGDGAIGAGETCDGDALGGQTCETLGFGGGALACTGDCALDDSGCTPLASCGDGIKDPRELCDGDDLGGATCRSEGHTGGALVCSPRCTLDASGCTDVPDGWFDVAWPKRRVLTIPKTKVTGAHVEFPAAFAPTDPALVAALVASATGLVFTTADGAQLSHEVELAADGRLVAWVELAAIDDADDTILYLYYGNPAADATQDAAATWSNGFVAVWHLGEAAINEESGAVHVDATGAHDGAQSGNEGIAEGKLGRAQDIGVDDYVEAAAPEGFALGDADATIAVWFKTSAGDGRGLVQKSDPAALANSALLFGLVGDKLQIAQGGTKLAGAKTLADGAWHHAVWTQDKSAQGMKEEWTLYVDGVEDAQAIVFGAATVAAHPLRLGGGTVGADQSKHIDSLLDEVEISEAVRSAAWIATAFTNQSDPASFFVVGPEEAI